jgi:hypothetical protein
MGDRIQAGAHGKDSCSAALRAALFAEKCRDGMTGTAVNVVNIVNAVSAVNAVNVVNVADRWEAMR